MIKADRCPYQRGRVFAAERQRQVNRPHNWWVLMKLSDHEPIDLILGQNYIRQIECQIRVIISLAFKRQAGKLTISRITVGIGHLRALEGAFVLVAEGVNSSKMEFFNTVAHLKPSPTELSYALDQGGQIRVYRWLCPLSLDNRREQMLVLP
jgi:hypothetical protein